MTGYTNCSNEKEAAERQSFFIGSHFEIVFKAFKVGYFLDIIKTYLGHNSDIKHTLSISVFVR